MNLNFNEAEELVDSIIEFMNETELENKAVIVCPPAVYLELATDFATESDLLVGGQNISCFESGAYTGEISALMLASMDVDYCLIGHSERRKYFHESNELLALKIDVALKNKITPIFCCGELLPEREAGKHFEVVKKQLIESVFHLNRGDFINLVIAYEPVWAIGT
jgi:triosephosphate isomerase (TIM)